MTLRALIVDDNASFLDAASSLLRRGGIDVVGVASSGADAIARADALRPDLVLVDIHLGAESGFDLARELDRGSGAGKRAVLLMSTHAEADFADLIAESPAVGFRGQVRAVGRSRPRRAG